MRVALNRLMVAGPNGLPVVSKNWRGPLPLKLLPFVLTVMSAPAAPKPLGCAFASYVQNRNVKRKRCGPTRLVAMNALLLSVCGDWSI